MGILVFVPELRSYTTYSHAMRKRRDVDPDSPLSLSHTQQLHPDFDPPQKARLDLQIEHWALSSSSSTARPEIPCS